MPASPPIVTELLSFGVGVYPPEPNRWEPHLHGFHQLDVLFDGEMIVDVEGEEDFEGRRIGQAQLMPPLVRHGYSTSCGFTVAMFKFHVAPRYWPLFGSRARRLDLSKHLVLAIERAGQHWDAGAPLARQEAIAVTTLCLIEFIGENPEGQESYETLDAFRLKLWPMLEMVESDPYEDWSVAELAKECHLTSDHFSKCFRDVLAQTPQQYLLRSRMRAAAHELLSDTSVPIKELAQKAGYATVHAFTRAFSRVFGISPASYRKAPIQM